MMNEKKIKGILDMGIFVISCVCAGWVYGFAMGNQIGYVILAIALLAAGWAVFDLFRLGNGSGGRLDSGKMNVTAHTLVLLDEEDNPVKSWDLTGKVAMIIGRKNKDETVDVDLGECEYSAMVDIQHAVLNYSLDLWYLEDLDSHNGVKVKKVEDGICYRLTQSRPCKIAPGDVIYIANTKLLFT